MTLVLRRRCPPAWVALGAAGLCRVSLCEVVGVFGRGPLKVIFLGVAHDLAEAFDRRAA